MKKYISILVVLILMPGLLSAGIFAKTGTAGLQFLKIGIDARAIGMAEAYTAVTDDISSVFWNPGGLALKPQKQVLFSHTEYVAGIKYEYVAVSTVTDIGVFAISGALLHMDWMDVYEEDNLLEPTGETFTNSDMALGLTYSNAFTDKFSFGFTVKYLRENLDEYAVNGMAVDLGSIYNTGWNNTTIGMALKNFGPNLKYEIDNDNDGNLDEDPFDLLDNDGDGLIDEDREEVGFKIPLTFSLGIASDLYNNNVNGIEVGQKKMYEIARKLYRYPSPIGEIISTPFVWTGDIMGPNTTHSYKDFSQILRASIQLDNCVDRKETYNVGMEYALNTFKIRSGYQFNYDAAGVSAGFGWTIPTSFAIVDIDYAYTYMGDLAESFIKTPHRLSLKMRF